jgi:hypothetical protein
MSKWVASIVVLLLFSVFSCDKNDAPPGIPNTAACDMTAIYAANEKKVTVDEGVWGTIAFMQGNCMPMIGLSPISSCPVKRTVRFYGYTLRGQAVPVQNSLSFFESFSTPLMAAVETDANGFFQLQLPAGTYTVVTVEDGKLYASDSDGQGGLNPVKYEGGLLKVNLTMTYKAVF